MERLLHALGLEPLKYRHPVNVMDMKDIAHCMLTFSTEHILDGIQSAKQVCFNNGKSYFIIRCPDYCKTEHNRKRMF